MKRRLYQVKRKIESSRKGHRYVHIGGKRYALGKISLREAQDKARKLEDNIRAGRIALDGKSSTQTKQTNGDPDINVWELADKHLRWVQSNRSQETFDLRSRYVNYFCKYLGQGRMVSTLKRPDIDGYIAFINDEHRKKSKGEEHALREIKAMFNWGEQNEYCTIRKNLFPHRQSGSRSGEKKYASVEEIGKLLSVVPDEIRDLICFSLYTGLRPKAVRELCFSDIQRDGAGRPYILLLKDKTLELTSVPKVKYIPLSTQAIEIIDRQKTKHPESDVVFLNDEGAPYTKNVLCRRIKRWAKKAGVQGIHPYSLRHSFGTYNGVAGTYPFILQQLMGHSRISTTEIYVSTLTDEHHNAMAKYGDQIVGMVNAAMPKTPVPSESQPHQTPA